MDAGRAVVSGASIAGLSAAFWLQRTGWHVTVLERAAEFRDGGQNVDVRGVGHRVLDLMGLTEAVRAQNTTETQTVLVDQDGSVRAELPSDDPDGSTAELEILRGDFARTLLEALPPDVEMLFDETIERIDDEAAGGVEITTARGRVLEADLLVIAEGVRSSTRDLHFVDAVARKPLGVNMVFGTIPRTASDDTRWRWLTTVGGRQVHLRPDNHGTTRAILAYAGSDDLPSLSREDALAQLRERFQDAGWEAPRVLDGFDNSDDVYMDQLTQIDMKSWHRGRVCVIGDAAWCVTPMGGGGSTLALTGGYVLAAELSTAPDMASALTAFEDWMRPLVDDVQHLPPGVIKFAYPRTALGLKVRELADKVLFSAPLRPLTAKITHVADDERELPSISSRR